jgi:hypothetical protein
MEKYEDAPSPGSNYHCMKHKVDLSQENVTCRDPKLYCKFRSSCVIWFTVKNQAKKDL